MEENITGRLIGTLAKMVSFEYRSNQNSQTVAAKSCSDNINSMKFGYTLAIYVVHLESHEYKI